MSQALAAEAPATRAGQAMTIIAQNIDQAAVVRRADLPGHGHADLRGERCRVGANQIWMRAADSRGGRRSDAGAGSFGPIRSTRSPARTPATTSGPARRSSTSISGRTHDIEIKLILKGGGCENTNAQYSLPAELRPSRAAPIARSRACGSAFSTRSGRRRARAAVPGAVGVCIGGDRTSGLPAREGTAVPHARRSRIPTRDSRRSKRRSWTKPTGSSVGPMGFSGRTSLIGCKIGAQNRLPASFFVSVAYDCWAFRRLGVRLDATTGAITSWLYRDATCRRCRCSRPKRWRQASRAPAARFRSARRSPTSRSGRSKSATSCSISGRVFTGRDAVHAHLMKHEPPVDLSGGVLYHCGPVVVKERDDGELAGHGRRPDDEHPRGAVSGRDHQALRRACRSSAKAAWGRRRSRG